MIVLRVLSAYVIELSTEKNWQKNTSTKSCHQVQRTFDFQMKTNKLSSENSLKYSWDIYLLKTIEK